MKFIVVIIGYNRINSIRSCYESVHHAMYDSSDIIDLCFSLDHSNGEDSIVEMIQNLKWEYGDKKIITHSERQGLRKHVISCGNLVKDYDALVMLEDDIVVSNSYFNYVKAAVKNYGLCPEVMGISLYSPSIFQQNGRFFQAEYNGSDTYLMQNAQSWGQAWTPNMWNAFYQWYQQNQYFNQPLSMADYSYSWDQRSWLKYFMGFVCSNNYYLIYPYHSFSTNTEEKGENRKVKDSDYEVSLVNGQKEFRMLPIDQCVKYNAHFERLPDQYFSFQWTGEDVLLDLNGSYTKYGEYRYVASTNYLPYESIASYGLSKRPQEVNLRDKTEGNDIHIYDLSKPQRKKHGINLQVVRYDAKALSWKRLVALGLQEFLSDLKVKH